jgi:PilZ domain
MESVKRDDRRRCGRVTLVGPALVSAPSRPDRPFTAVLDNANRIGAGLHAKESLGIGETISVTIAFLDHDGDEQQEKLNGTVAWVKPWERGFLIGVVWDQTVTKERNRWLYAYLNETLQETA